MRYGTRRHEIVCFSSQSWDDPLWTNKQHIMSRLAAEHGVLHMNHGMRTLPEYLLRRWRWNPADFAHPLRLLTDGVAHRGGNLWTGDHWGPLCAKALPRDGRARDFFYRELKYHFMKRYLSSLSELPIVWVYHPAFGDIARRMERALLVYDCVDDYSTFPNYRDAAWLMEREERLCREADLVFCTSPRLHELKRPFNPARTFLVHNVGDAEHFNAALDEATAVPDELLEIARRGPVVGFVGAVSDYKLDLSWIERAARARPDWQLVLIGPVGMADPSTDVSRARRLPNVHLLGARPYAELPRYIKGFDVATIPYRLSEHTASVFPIKFFEFLATGKPVVISALPSLAQFHDAVLVAEDADAFVTRCAEAMAEDSPEARARRLALAEQNSWPSRISTIMAHIERALDEE